MGKEASVISKWLSGTHNFTTDTLSDISDCLGVSMVQLFEEKVSPVVFKTHFAVGRSVQRYSGEEVSDAGSQALQAAEPTVSQGKVSEYQMFRQMITAPDISSLTSLCVKKTSVDVKGYVNEPYNPYLLKAKDNE